GGMLSSYLLYLVTIVLINANHGGHYASGDEGHGQCCSAHKVNQFTQNMDDYYNQCSNDAIEDGQVTNGHPKYDCVVQCYGEKLGVVNREGYVMKKEFMRLASDLYTETSMRELAREKADHCVDHSNKLAKGLRARDPSTHGCSLAMTLVNICTLIEVELNCPPQFKDTSERCNHFRKSLENFKATTMP
ncbi:hypothetical protein L9F63_022438, partial [Diploptera punctata]